MNSRYESGYDPSALSTNAPSNYPSSQMPSEHKFPHTRAQLQAIARQYRGDLDEMNEERGLVQQVVSLLVEEREEELKELLKDTFCVDDDSVEHSVLELMHKHRDDIAGVPFLFLTPTRRPISRPSSRASTSSTSRLGLRPETPVAASASAPSSPLVSLFRRPPNSPLAPMSTKSDYSPSSSPVLTHATVHHVATSQFTASLPASPISSPRLLNAKANEFRPIPRPLSAAASHSSSHPSLLRADTPSPDLWAHNSPRATSNLAIAAPLIADQANNFQFTPSSSLRSSHRPRDEDDEDEDDDDPFDPFSSNNPIPSFHSITISDFDTFDTNPWNSTSSSSDLDSNNNDSNNNNTNNNNNYPPNPYYPDPYILEPPHPVSALTGMPIDPDSEEANAMLTDGMTPFDVLSSVFGSSLAPSELEDALAANGFDFDRAMAWLVDRALPAPPPAPSAHAQHMHTHPGGGGGGVQGGPAAGQRMQHMGARVTLVSRDQGMRGGSRGGAPVPVSGGFQHQQQLSMQQQQQGGMARGSSGPAPRYVNGRPVPGGNRVCRYFVAGECLRADCRFSHDLERALCRFWLRGTCAKQESCEFLHHLPKDVDMASLNAVLSRANVPPGTGPLAGHIALQNLNDHNRNKNSASPPPDEFPALGYEGGAGGVNGSGRGGGGGRKFVPYGNDPSRTRFSAAVKKQPAPTQALLLSAQDDPNGLGMGMSGMGGMGMGMGMGMMNNNHHYATNNNNASTTTTTPAHLLLARRSEVMGPSADLNLHHQSAIIQPRASPRLKLRAPLLLPTLPTGETLNSMYMTYRQRAIQLGAARNACLSRAAEAWRRGDGAGAKRLSREGHEMNEKMAGEMREAASGVVRERARVAMEAVRGRDAGWSDDPGDRAARGKVCGGGFGVVLGIASASSVGGGGAGGKSPEERTEAMLDLHGLHANEATEVLEKFLLALEREHFYGLAYAIVGEEKHTGTQDAARGASRARLAMGVKEWLHRWGYPWSERDGIVCIDPLTHLNE